MDQRDPRRRFVLGLSAGMRLPRQVVKIDELSVGLVRKEVSGLVQESGQVGPRQERLSGEEDANRQARSHAGAATLAPANFHCGWNREISFDYACRFPRRRRQDLGSRFQVFICSPNRRT
jgi:hypothetical protein